MSNRDDLIYLSKLQEQCERYDGVKDEFVLLLFIEMAANMKAVAKLNVEFSAEERNLFSVAYKNVIGMNYKEEDVIFFFFQVLVELRGVLLVLLNRKKRVAKTK
jgi:hypothetical protein